MIYQIELEPIACCMLIYFFSVITLLLSIQLWQIYWYCLYFSNHKFHIINQLVSEWTERNSDQNTFTCHLSREHKPYKLKPSVTAGVRYGESPDAPVWSVFILRKRFTSVTASLNNNMFKTAFPIQHPLNEALKGWHLIKITLSKVLWLIY